MTQLYHQWIENILVYPTLGLGILSIIGCVYVIFHVRKVQKQKNDDYESSTDAQKFLTDDDVILHLILYLNILGIFWLISYMITNTVKWTPDSNLQSQVEHNRCVTIAFLNQFFGISMLEWQIVLPSYLLHILRRDSNSFSEIHGTQHVLTSVNIDRNDKNDKNDRIHNKSTLSNTTKCNCCPLYLRSRKNMRTMIFITIIIAGVCSIIPLKQLNGYEQFYRVFSNYKQDGYSYNNECWVDSYMMFIYNGLAIIAILFDIIVLFMTIIIHNKSKKYTNAYIVLVKRLLIWLVSFILARFVPFLFRLFEIIHYVSFSRPSDYNRYNAPLWLAVAHNYCLASFGIANACAWFFMRKVQTQTLNRQSIEPMLEE